MTDQPTPEGAPMMPEGDAAPMADAAPVADAAPMAPPPMAPPPMAPPPLAPYVNAPPPIAPPAMAPTAPPAIAWAAPAAAAPVKGERTVLALIAGILLLIGGIGGILIGLLIAVVGGTFISNLGDFGNIPDLKGANAGAVVGGVVAFVGAIIVAWSVAYLLAGIGVIRNSNWARVLGIVVGIISGLVWLSGATSTSGGLFALIGLGIHAYIVVALLFFWRTKPAV